MKTSILSFGVLCLAFAAGADVPRLEPLLAGFNPDPSICRVGEDYYLVTSSFTLVPGLPVYHSRDLTHWEVVGHAWTASPPLGVRSEELEGASPSAERQTSDSPHLTDDDGIWAPTIRYHDGLFYICVTWHGSGKPENYILTAKDPRGPWSRPVKVDTKEGIDGSLFFDDDGKVYYQSNTRPPKIEWGRQCVVWAQEIDVATGRMMGERHLLTSGSGERPVFAEGPHLYKIRGKYYLLMAQGGTGFDHAASLHVADSVFGPYRECAGNPVLTAADWGAASPLQAFGHADLVDTPDGTWYAVFLGKRMRGDGSLCPLGRETFLCPVEWQADGSARFRREEAMAGAWRDGTDTWYALMTHPEWCARLKKVKSHRETFEAQLSPGEAICIYRGGEGYYARTNETARRIRASVALDGEEVTFTMDGTKEAPLPVAPLCDQKKRNRFNGLLVGTMRPPAPAPSALVVSGVPWWDAMGRAVNAHGVCVVADAGRYWMFGEYKSDETNAFRGVSCYSSANLADWVFEGLALGVQADGRLGPDRVGERPKVVRAADGSGYVMLIHSDALDYKDPCTCYAVARDVKGPYTFMGPLLSDGEPIRRWDIGAFTDDDGTNYLLVHHGEIHRLAPDGRRATRIPCRLPAKGGESPALCRRGGLYYLFMSHTTSWERNDNFYFTAPSIEGPWTWRGLLAPEGTLTWNSQCSFVLKVAGTDTCLYMGDRWSYPRQASCATQVWQPLVFGADGSASLPTYREAWRPASDAAAPDGAAHGETVWKGAWRGDAPGQALTVPFAGTGVRVRADVCAEAGYGRIRIRDATGRLVRDDLVDFYAKAPAADRLVYVSPALPSGDYTLEAAPAGGHPEWRDKRRAHYGSRSDAIRVSCVEAVR